MLMTERQKTRAAAAQVNAEIAFWLHLAAYVLVIALLVGLNYRAGGAWWAQWPAFGWGLGVLGHAIGVFGRVPRFLSEWRLRKIERLRRSG